MSELSGEVRTTCPLDGPGVPGKVEYSALVRRAFQSRLHGRTSSTNTAVGNGRDLLPGSPVQHNPDFMAIDTLSGRLHLGTSSFTADGWEKSFYPKGIQPRDYLTYYATQFRALEVDATFYAVPSVSTVSGWAAKTPEGFQFALKAPQQITHERLLVAAEPILTEFLRATEPLGNKLAVILLQFPYFNQQTFPNATGFVERLKPFLAALPAAPRFALEIRNKYWLTRPFLDLLCEHNVALALIDHPWMYPPKVLAAKPEYITTDFTYIRWLGDRRAIEALTKTWDKTIIDRTDELQEWVRACRRFLQRSLHVYLFANNHYAGYAPQTLHLFQELFNR